jgi:hypothetical protein
MEANTNQSPLMRWSSVLAAGGGVILVAAGVFLAMVLWRRAPINGSLSDYSIVPPPLIACFVIASAIVLIASTFAWHIANQSLLTAVKRRAQLAIIAAGSAWLLVGTAVFLLARS